MHVLACIIFNQKKKNQKTPTKIKNVYIHYKLEKNREKHSVKTLAQIQSRKKTLIYFPGNINVKNKRKN